MSTTKVSSLFVDSSRTSGRKTHVDVSEHEREQRRVAFLRSLVSFSSSFDRLALQILSTHGVGESLQALSVLGDATRTSDVFVYPSTTPLYVQRGDKSCVTVNVTTAKLLALSSTSLADVDESVLQAEFAEIGRHKHRAVMAVVVCLSQMVRRSRLAPEDADYFHLDEAEQALIVPSIAFLVHVLKSGHDGVLSFSIGAHVVTSAPVLALQVGFDVDGRDDVVGYPGYAEFAHLVSDAVRRCQAGWAIDQPFIRVDRLVELSRTTANRVVDEPSDDASDDLQEPKRAKTVGRLASCCGE